MTISIKIKHDTPSSLWAVKATPAFEDDARRLVPSETEHPVVIQPGEEITLTLWDTKQFILEEVFATP